MGLRGSVGVVVHMRDAVRAVVALGCVAAMVGGCGVVGNGGAEASDTPTSNASPVTPAAAADPYSLPPDQRPPLFDPCTEIPQEALTQAGFGPGTRDDKMTVEKPGEKYACGWSNDEVVIGLTTAWLSESELRKNSYFKIGERTDFCGLNGYKIATGDDLEDHDYTGVAFTARGSLMVAISITSPLGTFKGENFHEPKGAFLQTLEPICPSIPRGFRK